jgi:hypothetical protein
MRNHDPSRREQVLDHSEAERKPEIEPHGVGNDFSGTAMAAIERVTMWHGSSLHIEFSF